MPCNITFPAESGATSVIKHVNTSAAKIMNRHTAGDKGYDFLTV